MHRFYDTFMVLFLLLFHFHYIENSGLYAVQHFPICVPQNKETLFIYCVLPSDACNFFLGEPFEEYSYKNKAYAA